MRRALLALALLLAAAPALPAARRSDLRRRSLQLLKEIRRQADSPARDTSALRARLDALAKELGDGADNEAASEVRRAEENLRLLESGQPLPPPAPEELEPDEAEPAAPAEADERVPPKPSESLHDAVAAVEPAAAERLFDRASARPAAAVPAPAPPVAQRQAIADIDGFRRIPAGGGLRREHLRGAARGLLLRRGLKDPDGRFSLRLADRLHAHLTHHRHRDRFRDLRLHAREDGHLHLLYTVEKKAMDDDLGALADLLAEPASAFGARGGRGGGGRSAASGGKGGKKGAGGGGDEGGGGGGRGGGRRSKARLPKANSGGAMFDGGGADGGGAAAGRGGRGRGGRAGGGGFSGGEAFARSGGAAPGGRSSGGDASARRGSSPDLSMPKAFRSRGDADVAPAGGRGGTLFSRRGGRPASPVAEGAAAGGARGRAAAPFGPGPGGRASGVPPFGPRGASGRPAAAPAIAAGEATAPRRDVQAEPAAITVPRAPSAAADELRDAVAASAAGPVPAPAAREVPSPVSRPPVLRPVTPEPEPVSDPWPLAAAGLAAGGVGAGAAAYGLRRRSDAPDAVVR